MDEHQHQPEKIFNIEAGSTPTTIPLPTSAGQISTEMLDPATGEIIERKVEDVSASEIAKEERIEDLKIDTQIDTIHGAAMEAFQAQLRLSQEVDPKFSARNSEVAAQYLKIALDAVGTRVDSKYKRNKIKLATNEGPRQVQNNVILADRNALLDKFFNNKTVEE